MKLAVYFVVKNFKHVTATCAMATFLTRNPGANQPQCKVAVPSYQPVCTGPLIR